MCISLDARITARTGLVLPVAIGYGEGISDAVFEIRFQTIGKSGEIEPRRFCGDLNLLLNTELLHPKGNGASTAIAAQSLSFL
jgi:hypothetical protein